MSAWFLDYETYSECDIQKLGAHAYALHPSTRIILAAIAKDDGPVLLWDHTDPNGSILAAELLEEMSDDDGPVVAHNAQFEHAISQACFAKTFSVPPPAVDRWQCTAAMCRRAAIPWNLFDASRFLQTKDTKHATGKDLIKWFCCPVESYPRTFDRAASWAAFRQYCLVDVSSEREIYHRLRKSFKLPKDEFAYDMELNWRGIPVNRDALGKAQALVTRCEEVIVEEFRALTGLNPTQRDAVMRWLQARGYPGENLQDATMSSVLEDPPESMTPEAVRALELRAGSAFTAIKKIPVMLAASEHDGRVRGGFLWSGALRTHRWAGRIIQPQNFKRPSIADTHIAYEMIKQGQDPEAFEMLWGAGMLEIVASCVRHFIEVPGKMLIDADFSNIEARITPWLCGQDDMLDEFRLHDQKKRELGEKDAQEYDVYVKMASVIFSVPAAKVSKDQRFVGKQATLACIAEGSHVLTDRGLIPIEQVLACDSVWDGVQWVRHEGVIYKGERETICYQGLQATPDHKVFIATEDSRLLTVTLWGALWFSLRLASEGERWDKIRKLEVGQPVNPPDAEHVCECGVPMWKLPVGVISLSQIGYKQGVCKLQGQTANVQSPTLVVETDVCGQRPVPKPKQLGLEKLWGEGDRVSLCIHNGGGRMGDGEFGVDTPSGDRPEEQPRALREGEFALGDTLNERVEHPFLQVPTGVCVHCGGVAIQRVQHTPLSGNGDEQKSDFGEGKESYLREAEGLAAYAGVVRVYDIMNAGPRHRFFVSGRLVHNCQFQVGWQKFKKMCAQYGRDLDNDVCKLAVERYREKRDKIVEAWSLFNNAAKDAIRNKGHVIPAGRVKFVCGKLDSAGFHVLQMKLPSGHVLTYPLAKLERVVKKFENGAAEVEEIQFWGPVPGKRLWNWQSTYGGKLLENCVTGDTEVLTQRGWVRVDSITTESVWDGFEFVPHRGLKKTEGISTIDLDGLSITGDHLIFTNTRGWVPAAKVDLHEAYKTCPRPPMVAHERPDRSKIWGTIGSSPIACRRMWESAVESSMRLWERSYKVVFRLFQGGKGVQPQVPTEKTANDSRHEQTPRILGVAFYARSVSPVNPPSVAQLWGAWDTCLYTLDFIREFLGRHGGKLSTGAFAGAGGQLQGVFKSELYLGNAQSPRKQSTHQYPHKHPMGEDHRCTSLRKVGYRGDHIVVPDQSGRETQPNVHTTKHTQPVYDLMDCGPRHQFVVRGKNKRPLIIHNCTQAVGGDFMTHGLLEAERRGYKCFATIHDQALCIAEDGLTPEGLREAMCVLPPWAENFPLEATASLTPFYTKD